LACPGIAALSLDKTGELDTQERRNRQTSLRGEYPSFAQRLLVED
jgi:hypothetical protein